MTGLENYFSMSISHCICQGSPEKQTNFQLCREQGKGEREIEERGKRGKENGNRERREREEGEKWA